MSSPAEPDATGEGVSPPVVARTSALLVGYGIAAGIFVLYVIGWVLGIPRARLAFADGDQQSLAAIMESIGAGIAIASGPLWFGCVFLLTRRRRTIVKLAWLAAGVVLLIPWPLLVGAR